MKNNSMFDFLKVQQSSSPHDDKTLDIKELECGLKGDYKRTIDHKNILDSPAIIGDKDTQNSNSPQYKNSISAILKPEKTSYSIKNDGKQVILRSETIIPILKPTELNNYDDWEELLNHCSNINELRSLAKTISLYEPDDKIKADLQSIYSTKLSILKK